MTLLEAGIAPGGTHRNLASAEGVVDWDPRLDEQHRLSLCDAQTSGGLLISTPPDRRDRLLGELGEVGVRTAAVVGEILDSSSLGPRRIHVLP